MSEKLLTVREVAHLLHISEKEVVELSQKGKIPAYRIGGLYLRFKKDQIYSFKDSFLSKRNNKIIPYTRKEKIGDFLLFNDFYILSLILIILMMIFIFKK